MSIQTGGQERIQGIPSRLLQDPATSWRDFVDMLVVLFKLRVVSLLLLAAVGGAFLGARGWPGVGALLLLLVTGGMAASGASAINQYLERSSDVIMSRTRLRPLPTGAIRHPRLVVAIGLTLILLPSLALLPYNPTLAFFLLLGAFIYVGVYTIWLKPRTLLNIVIGGAAGSAAVMSGGAAVHAAGDPAVITLSLLIFLWTPSHFWSLAILYKDDYERADVPMLPVHSSDRQAAWWVLLHTAATSMAALFLAFTPALGWAYLLPVAGATLDIFRRNARLIFAPNKTNARSFFIASNIYLTAVLASIMISSVLHNLWPLF